MKKRVCFILLILCIINLLFNFVCAKTEMKAVVHYDLQTHSVTINVNLENAYNRQVNIIISSSGIDLEKSGTDELNAQKIIVDTVRFDNSGRAEKKIILPDSFKSGHYSIAVYDDETNVKGIIVHAVENDAMPIISKIKGASLSQLIDLIENNFEALGVDENLFSKYKSDIIGVIYKNCPTSGYSVNGFLNQYITGLSIGMIKEGKINMIDILKYYSGYLNIDYSEKYTVYSAPIQNNLVSLLKIVDYSGKTFAGLYDECLLLAKINKAESNTALKEIMLANNTLLQLDMSTYSLIKNSFYENNVFSDMKKKTDYNSFSDVADAFESASTVQYREANKIELGNSNSGSGGGGRGSVTNVNGEVETAYENTEKPVFSDMSGHWAKAAVESLANKNIINGFEDGSFKGEQSISRAEFAKMICVLFDISGGSAVGFGDVSDSDWFSSYVYSLAEANIIQGFDGKFMPNDSIMRQDAAVIIGRALKHCGFELSGKFSFSDETEIYDYAVEMVKALASNGIIKGYDGKFEPKSETTRAQAATIIYNVSIMYHS